jgi:negative regulator of flagellin synthesis FlgM
VTNKISGYQTSDPLPPVKGQGGGAAVVEKPETSGAIPAGGANHSGDQVTLTGSAITLQKLGAALESAPVVNSAKVAAVKQAVQNGTYSIDPARIADKLVKFERDLK